MAAAGLALEMCFNNNPGAASALFQKGSALNAELKAVINAWVVDRLHE